MAQLQTKTSERKSARPRGHLAAIRSLNVPRYMGTWYEIAKLPNRFERKCVSGARAEYQLQADGTIRVINYCKLSNGKTSKASGVAKQIGHSNSPKLRVRFLPAWLSFLPRAWADYWVIDLDPEYQLAAVGEPKREYLWVLSRSKQVDPSKYWALVDRLARKGYAVENLQLIEQPEEPI